MSNYNSSLALEDVHEYARVDSELNLLVPTRHLSIGTNSADTQPLYQVVKVSGTITVSF
ncbi:hypothetical protein [Candidatus Protochlamydia sp. R18]|uniref:hypothetical protein n=1 Tax=Candidatus Protochlamydia sp. R18 TaxID=1353977 RepID=UPI00130E445A|nr:hypothetical protein [Candidatus Protochlamydia sp. R18]